MCHQNICNCVPWRKDLFSQRVYTPCSLVSMMNYDEEFKMTMMTSIPSRMWKISGFCCLISSRWQCHAALAVIPSSNSWSNLGGKIWLNISKTDILWPSSGVLWHSTKSAVLVSFQLVVVSKVDWEMQGIISNHFLPFLGDISVMSKNFRFFLKAEPHIWLALSL